MTLVQLLNGVKEDRRWVPMGKLEGGELERVDFAIWNQPQEVDWTL